MKATINFLIEAFMWLAALGIVLVFIAYAVALFGNEPLANLMATVLFPGIFVVWFPAVLVTSRLTRQARQRDFWKIALRGCPMWMRVCLYTFIGLGVANFLRFVVLGGNQRDIPMIYFGAGHILIFYSIAFCILYSTLHIPNALENRSCANGHEVSSVDSFCPVCGASLFPPPQASH